MINLVKHKEKSVEIVGKLTLEQKVNCMCQYQDDIPELGIKKYKHGTEASHGVSWLGKATMFPQPIGMASIWDKDLMEKVGEVIGVEARGFFKRDPDINGLTLWAPTIDMNRDPRWGRTDEGYGEDPFLIGTTATALIKGMQGDDSNYYRAVPTLKHFYGNNNEIERGFCSTDISERIKREYYLRVFEIAIKDSGVMSMMTAYNEVNNIPANVHPDLENIVRDEWSWPGFVVSDAGDVLSLIREHKYVETPEEAVALSIKAGVDSITDDHEICKKAIFTALEKGLLVEEDLNRALKRAFLVRSLLGEFDTDCKYSEITEDVIGASEHSEVALEASKKSIVLLKNSNNNLPITNKELSIGAIGNLADKIYRDWYSGEFLYSVTAEEGLKKEFNSVKTSNGNDIVTITDSKTGLFLGSDGIFTTNPHNFEMEDWGWGAITFRSLETGKYLTCGDDFVKAESDSIWGWFTKEVFYAKSGDNTEIRSWNNGVLYVEDNKLCFPDADGSEGVFGISNSTPLEPIYVGSGDFTINIVEDGLSKAVNLAKEVEKPIVYIGNHPLINGKETVDRHDITLAPRQKELALKVVEANPNAVLVVTGSYPFALEELNQKYDSIVYCSHLGQEYGNALTAVLNGSENPAGRLPTTWYKSAKDLGSIMDYELPKAEKTYLYFKGDVEYAFGHGISYTEFKYSNLKLNRDSFCENDTIKVSFDVTNVGDYSGDEVVQVYIKHNGTTVKRPLKQLVNYKRVFIKQNETVNVEFDLPVSEFNYWSETENKFCYENGIGEILIGTSSSNILLNNNIKLI